MIKTIYTIVFFILCLVTNFSWGQGENNNWYFGNKAALNFDNSVTALTNGKTDIEWEQTASISDSDGRLLFYTNGKSVWNKYHSTIRNGNNTLKGGLTTIIVPFPGNENKYYIFTSYRNPISGRSDKIYYSVVNMENQTGIVELVNKDLNTLPYLGFGAPQKSKIQKNHMTITKHSNEEAYWLVINPFDVFFAYKIDASGIHKPIISNDSQSSYYMGDYLETAHRGGSNMSISQDGNKLSFFNNYDTPGSNAGGTSLYLYNFNTTTGAVTYDSSNHFYNSNIFVFKGSSVSFSPNNQFIYFMANSSNGNIIGQYPSANITGNPTVLYTINSPVYSFSETLIMQLAADGKIYIPGITSNKLSVINKPNNNGLASNFVANQVNLFTGKTMILPQLVPILNSSFSCIDTVFVTETVTTRSTDIQRASITLTASNLIENNATASYYAGQSIELSTGFEVAYNGNFSATIENCNTSRPAPSFPTYDPRFIGLKNASTIKPNTISVYPNPSSGKIIGIESPSIITSWELISYKGSTIDSNIISTQQSTKTTVNVENLSSGVYFLKITTRNNNTHIKRILRN